MAAYIEDANAIQRELRAPLAVATRAYVDVSSGDADLAEAGPRLAESRRLLVTIQRRLARLRPPPDARRLRPSVTITGLGEAGDTVTLFDGSVAIATVTVAANRTWSVTVSLSIGTHRLTARQRINTPPHAGLTSNPSNLITIMRKG